MFDIATFLKLPETEQWDVINKYTSWKPARESLAELAFILRDEVVNINIAKYRRCLVAVYAVVHNQDADKGWTDNYYKIYNWFVCYAKPIHWIATAIAAKETK